MKRSPHHLGIGKGGGYSFQIHFQLYNLESDFKVFNFKSTYNLTFNDLSQNAKQSIDTICL